MKTKKILCSMLPLVMATVLCGVMSSCSSDDSLDGGKNNEDMVLWEGPISEENFPDENFRNYLLEQDYGKDGVITAEEIKGITSISINERKISSLKGIEYFTALQRLNCGNNQLTTLDVSKNTKLTELWCNNNQLTSLDVSKNIVLTSLNCYNNQLTNLDVSKNTALDALRCFNNQLTSLDISKNTVLTRLSCEKNQLINLDISKNVALENLECSSNQLTSLDISKNPAMTELRCASNQLTNLDVSKNAALTLLSCGGNQLTSLDVSKNPALTYLWCTINQLTHLDISKNPMLTELNCSANQIKKEAMDILINGLPQNMTDKEFPLYVCYTSFEGNVCTKTQVAIAKAKGWTPYCGNGQLEWIEYEGRDE